MSLERYKRHAMVLSVRDITEYRREAPELLDHGRVKAFVALTKTAQPNTKKVGRHGFFSNDGGGFACKLKSARCCAKKKNGQPCSRSVVHGLLCCFQHNIAIFKLRTDVSGIVLPGGKRMYGLFVHDPTKPEGEIIFRKKDLITPYFGEVISDAKATERYGDSTAPYGWSMTGKTVVDAACMQGIGGKANRAPSGKSNNARFTSAHKQVFPMLVATKPIRNGAEVFLSYGSAYQFTDSGFKPALRVQKKKSGLKKAPKNKK